MKESDIENAVEEVWPAPSFRKYQREAVEEIVKALYMQGYEGVALSAPCGAGKSLILYAVSKVVHKLKGGETFSTTPLNTLIDQIANDDLLQDVVTLKGKNNYECVHPVDFGKSVDDAICQRQSDFGCEYKDDFPEHGGCPYYGRKEKGEDAETLVTNLSYLMTNSMIPTEYGFEERELLEIDEVQNVENFALQFIGFDISREKVPVSFATLPVMPDEGCSMQTMTTWLKRLLDVIALKANKLFARENLTQTENDELNKLKRIRSRISNFLEDQSNDRHWTKTRKENGAISFEPVFIGRFIDKFLWSQAEKYVLSSATIPKGSFLDEIGLNKLGIKRIDVPSTFPKERRPVLTEYVGKMTQGERTQTLPKLVDKIEEIAEHHRGERGFIHCKSYDIMEKIYTLLPQHVKNRAMTQDPDNRNESLEEWFDSDTQMFLSVAQDEGISLDYDKARWQVVAKASYPFVGDERVSYRLNELEEWSWYSGKACIHLQQAVGRGMRAKDDYCVTYLLDSSFKSLLQKDHLFEDWFLGSVDCQAADCVNAMQPEPKFSFSS